MSENSIKTPYAMTKAVAEEIIELAKTDEKIYAITADVAHSTDFELIRKELPSRFFNVGIAEQNAIAMSSGLSRTGIKPYVAMFSSFASKRALDFIFADVCYPDLPVKIIATHGGTSFGEAGSTHHALSDITIMRSMPNITVVVPCDAMETRKVVSLSKDYNKPMYIRINRGEEEVITTSDSPFEIGKASVMKEGKDISIIACGSCVRESLLAAKSLEEKGINARVINMHTIKPLDKECVLESAKTGKIITVEDGENTGLGGAVSEVITDNGLACKTLRLGIDGICKVGMHKDIMHYYGIDAMGIATSAEKMLGIEK